MQLAGTLHSQLSYLVAGLHDSELDRQAMRSELTQARAEVAQLSAACREALRMEGRLEALQNEVRVRTCTCCTEHTNKTKTKKKEEEEKKRFPYWSAIFLISV